MADWHKIYSADWINLTYQVTDPQLATGLMMMMMHCLNQGGLPDDNEEIADITRLPIETVKAVRELRCVKRVSECRDGKFFFNIVTQMLTERIEFGRKQSNRRRGNATTETVGSTAVTTENSGQIGRDGNDHGQPRSTTVNHGQPMQSINHAVNQANTHAPTREAGGEFDQSDPDSDDLDEALADIFPGQSLLSRKMLDASQCAMSLKATAVQIRGWPAWMQKHWPKTGRTPMNFVDYFPQMLQAQTRAPAETALENFTGRGAAALKAAQEARNNGDDQSPTT